MVRNKAALDAPPRHAARRLQICSGFQKKVSLSERLFYNRSYRPSEIWHFDLKSGNE